MTSKNSKHIMESNLQPVSSRLRKHTKMERDDLLHTTLNVILQQNLLHWSDALALGSTCKTTRNIWKEHHEDRYMSPLLELLEQMLGPGEFVYGKEVLRDDLPSDYNSFSVFQKCDCMVSLLGIFVHNMRTFRGFCLEDPSNPAKNRACDARECYVGGGFETETVFVRKFSCRTTLALNIAIFEFAQGAMESGGNMYFDDVFRAKNGALMGGGSCYNLTILGILSRMFPLRDEDLVKVMRATYPSATELELLGPVVVKKVVLMAPFFQWVPAGKPDDDHFLGDLPTPLEFLDESIVRSSGMAHYLLPHHGIGF